MRALEDTSEAAEGGVAVGCAEERVEDVGGRGFAGVIGFSRRTGGGVLAFAVAAGVNGRRGWGSTFVITV